MNKNKQLVIYQAKSGALELRADVANETIWANRTQMSKMFGVNPQAISKHIHNIYKEKELLKKATSSKMELVQIETARAEAKESEMQEFVNDFKKISQDGGISALIKQKLQPSSERYKILASLKYTGENLVIDKEAIKGKKSVTIKVPDNIKGLVIGKGGQNIKRMSEELGVFIKII